MKDTRLVLDNLALALKEIDVQPGDTVHLYFNRYLRIQAHDVGMRLCAEFDDAGLGIEFEYHQKSNDEMPPGYDEALDATMYFPWIVEVGRIRLEFDGTYDVDTERRCENRATFCKDCGKKYFERPTVPCTLCGGSNYRKENEFDDMPPHKLAEVLDGMCRDIELLQGIVQP